MVSLDAFRPLQFFNLPSAWAGHVDHIFRILAMIRTGVQPLVSQTTLLLILGCWVGHPIVLDSCCITHTHIYMINYIYIVSVSTVHDIYGIRVHNILYDII